MRIVFFGTPEFAVPSLRALLRERYAVVGVVTQPDKPRGRSRSTLLAPPVKLEAERQGIPVLQPVRPTGDLFLASLRRLEADLGVVVAYGHLLRPAVLTLPRHGMINVHASLLPRWRGAAPIQHAILAGDTETGVSIMQMEEGLDSGPVLHRIATPIGGETAGALAARLAELGATALVDALSLLSAGFARPERQDESRVTFAPKIDRDSARLDWDRDATALARQVCAFDPAPGAWTTYADTPLKIFGATAASQPGEPGLVLAAGDRMLVGCGGGGALSVSEVQPAGKSRLTVEAWVRGRGIAIGARLV